MSVVVIGAGAIGLSSALAIQEALPGINVTLISEAFSPETTSDVAAGIFSPIPDKLKGTNTELLKQMFKESFARFDQLLGSDEASVAGISRLSGYNLYKNKPEFHFSFYKDIVYECRYANELELASIPVRYEYGLYATTVQIESRQYLPWLLKKIKQNGGDIQQKKVTSLKELAGKYDVIVNCSGIGSRFLTPDYSVYPVRGQWLRVRAPWIRHFYRAIEGDQICSVIPCYDTVLLGSTFDPHDWDKAPRQDLKNIILERCKRLVPALRGAELISEGVGLRPWREPIRMERELMSHGSHKQQVVHNYGHCSNGVNLSWGAAMKSVDMVKQALIKAPIIPAKL